MIVWKRSQTTETIGTIEGYIPEIITTISIIQNKFGLDAAEVEKIIQKCSHLVLALFETRESQVLHVILCLRRSLLACRRRKIERKGR